jgi:hypothetical protein
MPSAADQDLAHRIWWELSRKRTDGKILHEGDVFGIALRRLDEDLPSGNGEALIDIEQEILIRESSGNEL